MTAWEILELYWGHVDYIGVLVGYWGHIGVMLGFSGDNGKENANYYIRGLNEANTSGSRLPCGKSST